tara:strand:+ start:271 stop:384 length:114 start_codon:yes stop_codon:yes gene_type:complete
MTGQFAIGVHAAPVTLGEKASSLTAAPEAAITVFKML